MTTNEKEANPCVGQYGSSHLASKHLDFTVVMAKISALRATVVRNFDEARKEVYSPAYTCSHTS